jgi:hypothetical protein
MAFSLRLVSYFLAGVALTEAQAQSLTPAERRARDFEFQALRLGAPTQILDYFSQVERRPSASANTKVFHIFNPSPQVSLAVARFENNRLRQFELRYFDGEGIRTLTRAGHWDGLRNRLIELFGPPTASSPKVPVRTDQSGLDPRYAAINAEWNFPRVARRINYICMIGDTGGVGVVTISHTGSIAEDSATEVWPRGRKQRPFRENPGF